MTNTSGLSSQGETETILIADNEILERIAIAEYLRRCGYRVVEASSADEALTILQKDEIQVNIVFSDVKMPGSIDGFGLSRWIRENRKGIQVVLAATIDKAVFAAGNLCEEGPHMAKPYEPQQVIEWIKRIKASNPSKG